MSWNRASTWCTAVLSMPDCGGGAQGGTRERGLGLLLSGRGGERHHDSAWGAGVGAHRLLTTGPGRFAFRATFWRYMSASAAAIRSSGAVVSLERVAMPALKLRCNSSPCQGKRVCSIKSRIDWRTIADPSAQVWGRITANSSPPRRAQISVDRQRDFLDFDTIYEKIRETVELGGTGVLMQGGLHPDLKIDWHEKMLRGIKERFPQVH